ncbi:hypothetical protein ACWNS2_00170 [Planococcus plakortidis]
MAKEKKELQGLSLELDGASGGLNVQTQVLEDIKTNFMQLVEDMNEHEDSPDLNIRFREWHRELRILSQLMQYSMSSLKEEQQNIKYLSEGICEETLRNEK